MFLRFISSIFLFLSILFLPLWVYVAFALVLVFVFKNYYEAIIIFYFADILYGFPILQVEITNYINTLVLTISSFIMVVFSEYIKRYLRIYD
jgi:hypothetical protein